MAFNNSSDAVVLPSNLYWRDRLSCKGEEEIFLIHNIHLPSAKCQQKGGKFAKHLEMSNELIFIEINSCNFPLLPPVHYCHNIQLMHPLCKDCNQCSVENCRSKKGTNNRSIVLEKILNLSSFYCEFSCKQGPFESSEYRNHMQHCYVRPIQCTFCRDVIPFLEFFNHLQISHGMKENFLDSETIILNFTEEQPKIQFVRFFSEVFFIRFENGKLWVEYYGFDVNAELDYRIRVNGNKYYIDLEMQVHAAREDWNILMDNSNSNNGFQLADEEIQVDLENNDLLVNRKFIIPPKNEELFMLFIREDDNSSISSIESMEDLNAKLIEAEMKTSFSV